MLGLAVIAAFGATACNAELSIGEQGSGLAETVTFDVESFDELNVSDSFDVEVTIGDGPTTVEVTVDDNLVDDLDVERDGDRLEIGWDRGRRTPKVSPTAVITVSRLEALDASGAARVSVQGLDASRFSVDSSGAAEVDLVGTIEQLTVDGSGASQVRVTAAVDEATFDLSGATSADMTGAELGTADVDLSGGSRIEFGPVGRVDGQLSGGSVMSVPDGVDASVRTSGGARIERS